MIYAYICVDMYMYRYMYKYMYMYVHMYTYVFCSRSDPEISDAPTQKANTHTRACPLHGCPKTLPSLCKSPGSAKRRVWASQQMCMTSAHMSNSPCMQIYHHLIRQHAHFWPRGPGSHKRHHFDQKGEREGAAQRSR